MEPDEVVKPEVGVKSARRRRSKAAGPKTRDPVRPRTWVVYTALTMGAAGLMFRGYLSDRPREAVLATHSRTSEVRSTISETADSLQVVVEWDLTLADSAGSPDSVRIRVIADKGDTLVVTQPADQLADTVFLPAPAAGQTAKGLSCAAAQHPQEPLQEVCTPWQYVRPSVTTRAAAGTGRVVIQPRGLQVDPDVGGKCAEWQRTHRADSLWIEVNRTAVPECTGPNWKPTVAQFCAFVVLPDGRRVKATNSINNPYCEVLFAEWIRERYS